MKRDQRSGLYAFVVPIAALGDLVLAIVLTLLAVDLLLPRRTARQTGEAPDADGPSSG